MAVDCGAYIAATSESTLKSSQSIPTELLAEDRAVRCLVRVLETLDADIRTSEPKLIPQLLSALGGLIRIKSGLKPVEKKEDELKAQVAFVEAFQKYQSVAAISALTFAVRNKNDNLRAAAYKILPDVITDSTLCVLLIHLNDTRWFDEQDHNIKGRGNLLYFVDIHTSTAIGKNFESIVLTKNFVEKSLPADKSDLKIQMSRLHSISQSIEFQNELEKKRIKAPKNTILPAPDEKACSDYINRYPGEIKGRANLKYGS
jgi:hypothetical protein